MPSEPPSLRPFVSRGASRADFRVDVVTRRGFDESLLRELYELANALMGEPYEHFARHAHTNDTLHVFRRPGDARAMGFQFWLRRAWPGLGRIVVGGKLRMRPEARRSGLHLASGLEILERERREHPGSRITRLSVASLFGFVSITRRLADYRFVSCVEAPELVPAVAEIARESGYRFDPKTGQAEVGISITKGQLAAYPAAYFESPAAAAYRARNPEFASNGRYLAFAFDASEPNLAGLRRGVGATVAFTPPD